MNGDCAMERALSNYYQEYSISPATLKQKIGQAGLNLEAMELAIPRENKRLTEIEQELNHRIIGQPDAINSIMSALGRGEFRNPRRPVATLLFLGPTGVGKTETAQELAAVLNDGDTEGVFTRIDCSLYANGNEVSRLVGASPNYVGYEQPPKYSDIDSSRMNVVVFDEIEKGHQKLHDQMLQILDNGEIDLMNSDEKVSFRNSIIIATSNVGSGEISQLTSGKRLGFINLEESKQPVSKRKIDKVALESLMHRFRPEFVGRFNEKVVFSPLDDEKLGEVLDRYVEKMNEREQHRTVGVELAISPELRDKLIACVDDRHQLGARPVIDYFENTVGKEYGERIAERSIPWKSFSYAVPAETAGFDGSSMTAAFYFERTVDESELMNQEIDEELYQWLQGKELVLGKTSKPNRRAKSKQ
jgi:ATP-dependent Clp protease ATP-binding subunit ClpA